MPLARVRLDKLLLDRGWAATRQQAQALILAGSIRIPGQTAAKPGQLVAPDIELERTGPGPRFASRAGDKLEAALAYFKVEVRDRVALDIGSSTGGFTDCLLQHGAARVHAVDSGTNQMIWRLRHDPRVHLLERTNARYLTPAQIGEPCTLLTVDVSFIAARRLLPALVPLLSPAADAVILVKPQFEAGREAVGKGGLVRDPEAQQAAVQLVATAAVSLGFRVTGVLPSPVLGATGNQEFLLHFENA